MADQPNPGIYGEAYPINPVIAEMHSQNDRGAAITGCIFVEQELRNTILAQWPPMSRTMQDRIFRGYGPLASLSALIDVATGMGIIHPDARSDFFAIKRIRNDAAHIGTPFEFTSDTVRKHLAVLPHIPDNLLDYAGYQGRLFSRERRFFTTHVKFLSAYLFFVRDFRLKSGPKAVLPRLDISSMAPQNRSTNDSSDSNSGS
jgi:hypothetical protein